MWSASTTEREGDPDANVMEDSGSAAGNSAEEEESGNKVARILYRSLQSVRTLVWS